MKVTLTVKRLVDTADKREIQFTIASAETGETLYSTKSTETRQGLRTWTQQGLYAARGRIRSWCKKRGAEIVDKPDEMSAA